MSQQKDTTCISARNVQCIQKNKLSTEGLFCVNSVSFGHHGFWFENDVIFSKKVQHWVMRLNSYGFCFTFCITLQTLHLNMGNQNYLYYGLSMHNDEMLIQLKVKVQFGSIPQKYICFSKTSFKLFPFFDSKSL